MTISRKLLKSIKKKNFKKGLLPLKQLSGAYAPVCRQPPAHGGRADLKYRQQTGPRQEGAGLTARASAASLENKRHLYLSLHNAGWQHRGGYLGGGLMLVSLTYVGYCPPATVPLLSLSL